MTPYYRLSLLLSIYRPSRTSYSKCENQFIFSFYELIFNKILHCGVSVNFITVVYEPILYCVYIQERIIKMLRFLCAVHIMKKGFQVKQHLRKEFSNKVKCDFQVYSQNCEKRLLASPYLSFLPPTHMEQLGSHRTEFHEI